MTNATPLQLFKNLSDDTRLSLVLLLREKGELCVCELSETLRQSQPKISRHLALLREGGCLLTAVTESGSTTGCHRTCPPGPLPLLSRLTSVSGTISVRYVCRPLRIMPALTVGLSACRNFLLHMCYFIL
ncbi:hypothetical protein ABMA09_22705 [Erwinia rhapontici]